MFDIFKSLFDQTFLVLVFRPSGWNSDASTAKLLGHAALNTLIRFAALSAFTYGAIRVVATAISHGPL